MRILLSIFVISSLLGSWTARAQTPGDTVAAAMALSDAIETYREMQDLFNEICSTQDPATGAMQFAENAVLSNAVISPDDGVLDCNSQLVALAQAQEELVEKARALGVEDLGSGCGGIDDPAARVRGDLETGLAAAEEVQFNTGCTLGALNSDAGCGNFMACVMATTIPAFAVVAPALNCPSRTANLVGGCAYSAMEGAVNAVGGALSFLGDAALWTGDKGVRATMKLSAAVAQTRSNLIGNGTQIDDNVEMLTETDERVLSAMENFANASVGEQMAMIRNGAANLWNGINSAIINNFGCLEWDRSQSPAVCKQVVQDFCSAPCQQKTQMICGVLGFAAGELVSAALFGGAFEVAATVTRTAFGAGRILVRGAGNAIESIPGINPYLRRLGQLRTLTARGLAATGSGAMQALRLVGAQLRYVKSLPLSRAVLAAAPRIGRGLQMAPRNAFVTATWNGVRWVPHKTYGLIKSYLSLSEKMFNLGRASVRVPVGFAGSRLGAMFENMNNAKVGAVSQMSTVPLELADEMVGTHRVVHVRATVPLPGHIGTQTVTYRYQVVKLEPTAIPGSDLLALRSAPVATAAPGLSAVDNGAAIVVTGSFRGVRGPGGGVRLEPTARRAPQRGGLSQDELARRLGDTEVDAAGAAIPDATRRQARELAEVGAGRFTRPEDFNRAGEQLQQIWMRDNARLRATQPELFVPFNQLPAAARIERIDRLGAVLRVGRPSVLNDAPFRAFRSGIAAEVRLADDAVRAAGGKPPTRVELAPGTSRMSQADANRLDDLEVDDLYRSTDLLSESRHVDEMRITGDHLADVLKGWPATFKDEVFELLRGLPLEQRRKSFAILVNAEGVPPVNALRRVKDFSANRLPRERYLSELDTQIADLNRRLEMAPEGADVSALANSLNRLNFERELIDKMFKYELLSLFSGRAHNELMLARGREAHMVGDSFGVDFRVRGTDVSFIRGSSATTGTSSSIIGGFMTPGHVGGGFQSRRAFRDSVAGPTDNRAHILDQGYTEINRVAARDGEVYTLSMAGQVTYGPKTGAIAGTGGNGTRVEVTTGRFGNPMKDAQSRLITSVDTLSCPNRYVPPCSTIYDIQESITPARLVDLDSNFASIPYLEGKLADVDNLVLTLGDQARLYARAVERGGEARNLSLLRQEFPDLSSALTVRREIEQKLAFRRAQQADPNFTGTRTADVELRIVYDTEARAIGDQLAEWKRANPTPTAGEVRTELLNRLTATEAYKNFSANQMLILQKQRSIGLRTSMDPEKIVLIRELNDLLIQQRHIYGGFSSMRYNAGRAIERMMPPLNQAEVDQLRVLIDDTLPIDGVGYDPAAYPGRPEIIRQRPTTSTAPPPALRREGVDPAIAARAGPGALSPRSAPAASAATPPPRPTATPSLTRRASPAPQPTPQADLWRLRESGEAAAATALETAIESRLRTGRITEVTPLNRGGHNNPQLVTFDDGSQGVWKPYTDGPTDVGNREIATYEVDRMLNLNLVPLIVERELNGVRGTMQVYVPNSGQRFVGNPEELLFFDELLYNTDRNAGNALSVNGRLVAIDNAQAFGLSPSVAGLRRALDRLSASPNQALARQMLTEILPTRETVLALRRMTPTIARARLDPYLTDAQIRAMIDRRNTILQIVDEAETKLGAGILRASGPVRPMTVRPGYDYAVPAPSATPVVPPAGATYLDDAARVRIGAELERFPRPLTQEQALGLDDPQRVFIFEEIAGVRLTNTEAADLLLAHNKGKGVGQYTFEDFRLRAETVQRILRSRGIADAEIRGITRQAVRGYVLGSRAKPKPGVISAFFDRLWPRKVIAAEITEDMQLRAWRASETGTAKQVRAIQEPLERTLREAPIVEAERIMTGENGAKLITFDNGLRGVWKPYGENALSPFGRNELAAYDVDRLLGQNLVPTIVERTLDGRRGTMQVFVPNDGVRLQRDPPALFFFDDLLGNGDRNAGNLLTVNGRMVAIDNAFSFDRSGMSGRLTREIEGAQSASAVAAILPQRRVVEALRRTTPETWRTHLSARGLPERAITGFLQRREEVLRAVDMAVAKFGDDAFPIGPSSPLIRRPARQAERGEGASP